MLNRIAAGQGGGSRGVLQRRARRLGKVRPALAKIKDAAGFGGRQLVGRRSLQCSMRRRQLFCFDYSEILLFLIINSLEPFLRDPKPSGTES